MATLGILLRRHREDAQLTQEELAERAGISARTISDIERGVRSRAYADTAGRLVAALSLEDSDRSIFLQAARGRLPPSDLLSAPRVPRPLTPLVGRQREVDRLVLALADQGSRLVTITGIGGIGKTRLALAVAAELELSYAGRVHFIPITSNQEPDSVERAVARATGLREQPNPQPPAALFQAHRTLVVLDGLEHLRAAASLIETILTAVPELQILGTSRERLHITGETELALLPLAVPDVTDAQWFAAPAAQLFLERVRAVRADLQPEPLVTVDICQRLSGLPLALELAAARVRHLPLRLLRDRLASGMEDLADTGAGSHGHRSLAETLAWSTSTLTSQERRLLQVAALFPGGLGLDAAQSLCRRIDVIPAASGLVDKGLLLLDDSTGQNQAPRWQMLDLVREFAAQQTGPVPAATRRAYIDFYLVLLGTVQQDVGRELGWFEVLAREEPNLRTALSWAAEARAADTLLRLCGGTWQFWQARGDLAEGRRWLELGLSMRPPAGDRTRMTALWGLGWLAYHQADERAADRAARELSALAERHKDDGARRNALTLLGMVAIARDDAPSALTLLTDALLIARRLRAPWIVATSLLNLGLADLCAGETPEARSVIGEALAAYRQIGDQRFESRCLGYLGFASLLENDPDRAQGLFAQSLTRFRNLGEPEGTAEGLTGIAAAAAAAGQWRHAAMLAGAAERLRDSYAGRELPLDQRTTGRYLAAAAAHLGADAWAEEWARGRDLTVPDAVELALRAPPEAPLRH